NRRNHYSAFELSALFQSKTHFLIMNLAVILSCCITNMDMQLFCNPVMWASVVLLLFCVSFLYFPFANKNNKVFPLISFFSGLGFFIAIYVILFGRQEYLIFIAISLPIFLVVILISWMLKKYTGQNYYNALWFYVAFILAPYFIILQLILLFKGLQTKSQKISYVASSFLILFICLALTYQMNRIFEKAAVSKNLEADLIASTKNPINYYLLELILGSHWKYHTEICMYDGNRPPFHDPVLIVANKILFPYEHFASGTNLYPPYSDKRYYLYKTVYPNNPLSFNCNCAIAH
ncbi:MAG: hypothetical protein ACHQII_06540, partial [Bacteroidia bacterium]